jgi:multisubunit Na+/H+ antiporter MnhE subunit
VTRLLLVAAGLGAIYLLVLTSLAPGDVLTAIVLGLAVALLLRPRPGVQGPGRLHLRASAVPVLVRDTAAEMVRGSWRVVRFCLTGYGRTGFVEIPRDGRTDADIALWGLVTGEAPDEIVVDVDDERDVLVVHLVDAGDPDGVRARHRRDLDRRRGKDAG